MEDADTFESGLREGVEAESHGLNKADENTEERSGPSKGPRIMAWYIELGTWPSTARGRRGRQAWASSHLSELYTWPAFRTYSICTNISNSNGVSCNYQPSPPHTSITHNPQISHTHPLTSSPMLHPSHPVPNPAALHKPQATHALIPAPTPTNTPALTYPQSMSISSAATLFTITAQLTAVAELGRS